MLPIVARAQPERTVRTPGQDVSVASPVRTFKLAASTRANWPAGRLRLGAQDGGERLADILHLLHLHQVGKAVGALQGRS